MIYLTYGMCKKYRQELKYNYLKIIQINIHASMSRVRNLLNVAAHESIS